MATATPGHSWPQPGGVRGCSPARLETPGGQGSRVPGIAGLINRKERESSLKVIVRMMSLVKTIFLSWFLSIGVLVTVTEAVALHSVNSTGDVKEGSSIQGFNKAQTDEQTESSQVLEVLRKRTLAKEHFAEVPLPLASTVHSFSPMAWEPGMVPTVHNLISGKQGQQVDLMLTSAPVLRMKQLESQLQLKVFETVVDMTQPARNAHNLKRQVRNLQETDFSLRSEFLGQQSDTVEFYVTEQLVSHEMCNTICLTKNSRMLTDLIHLRQLIKIYGENRLQAFWIESIQNQSISETSYYQASYDLQVLFNNSVIQVFPYSEFNNQTTECWSFVHHEAKKCSDVENLGALTIYYEQHGNEDFYYNRHIYDLSLKVNLGSVYKSNWSQRAVLDADMSDRMDWHFSNLYFETFIPRPSNIQKLPIEFAHCVCQRHQNVSKYKIRSARSTLNEAALLLAPVNLGIEQMRVRQYGHPHLSSLTAILNDKENEGRRSEVDMYLDSFSVLPLLLNGSNWVTERNESANMSLVHQYLTNFPHHREQFQPLTFDSSVVEGKEPLAQPLLGAGALTMLKILSVGTPYLLEEAAPVLSKLLSEHAGTWFKPDLSQGNEMSAEKFSEFLNAALGSATDAQFGVADDRLTVNFPDSVTQLGLGERVLERSQIDDFSIQAMKLANLPQVLKEKLPALLISRLVSQVRGQLVPDSSIFIEVLESKSFLVFRLYYQSIIPSSQVTSYRFYVLAHAQRAGEYFYYQVQNISMNMKEDLYLTSQESTHDCLKALMASVPQSLEDRCVEKPRLAPVVELALKFKDSYALKIDGPGVIHYSCRSEPASMYALNTESSLFLVHDSCSLHGIFADSTQYHKKAVSNIAGEFTVLPILRYVVPEYLNYTEKTEIILWTFGSILGLVLSLLCIVTLGCYYAKKKLKMRLAKNDNDNFELQVNHDSASRSTHLSGADDYDLRSDVGVNIRDTPPVFKGRSLGATRSHMEPDKVFRARGYAVNEDMNRFAVETNEFSHIDDYVHGAFPDLEEDFKSSPSVVSDQRFQGSHSPLCPRYRMNQRDTNFKTTAKFSDLKLPLSEDLAVESIKV